MNQANRKPAEPVMPVPDQQSEGTEALIERLTTGETAVAQRRDLGELHKRLVTMITSMTEGLGEAQAKRDQRHEGAIGERFEALEHAVNGLESALRIELEPMIARSVAEVSGQPRRPGRTRWWAVAAAFCIGLAIPVIFSDQFAPIVVEADILISNGIERLSQLSPNGGSSQ